MDSVHMSWGWLVALALVVGLRALSPSRSTTVARSSTIAAVTPSSGSNVIDVLVHHHACGLPQPEVVLAEDAAVVSLRAVYDDSGDCDEALVDSIVSVELARPLGSRSIEVRTRNASAGLSCAIDGAVSDRCFRG